MASFCFLSHQKSALRLLNRGQKMTQVIDKLAKNLNNEWRGCKIRTRSTYFICVHVLQTKKRSHLKKITFHLLGLE